MSLRRATGIDIVKISINFSFFSRVQMALHACRRRDNAGLTVAPGRGLARTVDDRSMGAFRCAGRTCAAWRRLCTHARQRWRERYPGSADVGGMKCRRRDRHRQDGNYASVACFQPCDVGREATVVGQFLAGAHAPGRDRNCWYAWVDGAVRCLGCRAAGLLGAATCERCHER